MKEECVDCGDPLAEDVERDPERRPRCDGCQEAHDKELAARPRPPHVERRHRVEGCAECESLGNAFGPSHDRSSFCESPSDRSHCTCDWCF